MSFPIGDAALAKRGSIELKMAWKELAPTDIPARYYTVDGEVKNNDTGKFEPRKLGLVGMHIAMRTVSRPAQSTAGKNAVLDVATGLPREPKPGETPNGWFERVTTSPVQVTRVIPIPAATAALNAEVQAQLRALEGERSGRSVFQFYELIGAQWPVFPGSAAFPSGNGSAPKSIVHKTPGSMVPVYVANTAMETYFQTGIQAAGPLAQDDRLPDKVFVDAQGFHVTVDGDAAVSSIRVPYQILNGGPVKGVMDLDITGPAMDQHRRSWSGGTQMDPKAVVAFDIEYTVSGRTYTDDNQATAFHSARLSVTFRAMRITDA